MSIQPESQTYKTIERAINSAIGRLNRSGMPFSHEDARQQAWLAILESWQRYVPDRGGEFSYAYTIAKRVTANYATWASVPVTLSKKAIEGGGATLDPLRKVTSADGLERISTQADRSPERESLKKEIAIQRNTLLRRGRRQLDRFLMVMPPKESAMIRLVLDEGIPPKEAAQRVGLRIWHPAIRRIVTMAHEDLEVNTVSVKLARLEA